MGRTNEALWSRAKAEAKAKMGGKHSARSMQLAGKIYKDRGCLKKVLKSEPHGLSS